MKICYKRVQTTYENAVLTCRNDRGHLFVPNNQQELEDVMKMAQSSYTYFIGLQDWARRGGGSNTGTWTAATNFNADADGHWRWMDRSSTDVDATNPANFVYGSNNGIAYYTNNDLPYIQWTGIPNNGDLYTMLKKVDSTWRIESGSSLSATNYYICEYSKICFECPGIGWSKFDGYCYKVTGQDITYDNALLTCTSENAHLPILDNEGILHSHT